ncbi:MAG: MBL fold metallo-hydrolase [Planctomycetes bacterium]|jgi:glyoxylase-like metal-dependent hydrolase (beta-lactamase superfamily II)|nr:MBL fold metallo-hydrolase [Planctomycetota bacterium]MBT6542204.1 MBL fold metallo-hydrolase [Planctomycetota bacterium]MBT6783190.1 MBL fold metallo-hydrolase [Planctomycetota bacterium]MBT6968382.1 MBL fold metallo-hydrolase [Planctomycetota bacterium]MBT7103392.1 MBL fold metallo-hydrolase [Planctomycetota bacterium]
MNMSETLGRWKATIIDGGSLSLDGGAMFGSVPRVVWERCIEPDTEHRIPMKTRLLLLEDSRSDRVVLIDAGVGDKEDPAFRDRFAIQLPEGTGEAPLRRAIRSVGVDPQRVTDLILTHLHFDHVGGATELDREGQSTALFPDATHWVQQANWDTGLSPNARERASYLRQNIEPLAAAPLEKIDGNGEILPGISVERVDGHTVGMQTVRIEGGGRVMRYLADLAPTWHHLRAAWTMGYDICAITVVEEKQRMLQAALEEQALLVLEHDPVHAVTSLEERNGKIVATKP